MKILRQNQLKRIRPFIVFKISSLTYIKGFWRVSLIFLKKNLEVIGKICIIGPDVLKSK